VTSVARDAVVEVDYRVRRRKYHDTSFLIRRTDYVELDDLTDAVWLACERGGTVGDVINVVVERQRLPLSDAVGAVAVTLERFRALGFVTYTAPAVSGMPGE
jgi:nucleoside-diphosphate-sugar epimerase